MQKRSERKSEMHASARNTYTHIYMRTSLTPPLRMHAIPFHAHIIKSPKSREIAPRRACPLCSFDHLSISPAIGYPFRLFPSLGSPLARSRTYTAACHIGSLFNFVDRTKRDMCSRYLRNEVWRSAWRSATKEKSILFVNLHLIYYFPI